MRGPLPALAALRDAIGPAWAGEPALVWPLVQVIAIWAGISLLPLGVELEVQKQVADLAPWADPSYRIRKAAQEVLEGKPPSGAFAQALALAPKTQGVVEDFLRGIAPKLAKPMAETGRLDPDPKYAHLAEGTPSKVDEEPKTSSKVGTDEEFGPRGEDDPNYTPYEEPEEPETPSKVGSDEDFGPRGPEDPNYKPYQSGGSGGGGMALGALAVVILGLLLFRMRRKKAAMLPERD